MGITCAAFGWFALERCQPFLVHAPGTPYSQTESISDSINITRDGIYLGRVRSGRYILHNARIECFRIGEYGSYSICGKLEGGGSNSPISVFRAEALLDGERVELEATHRLGAPTPSGRHRRSVSTESVSVDLPRSLRTRLSTTQSVSVNLIGLRDETGHIKLSNNQVKAINKYMTKIEEQEAKNEATEP